MSEALQVIERGRDTSYRTVAGTRQHFQHFDRVNEKVNNKLVIVQGAFRARYGGGAGASAGTHNEAGCFDIRTWNLTTAERETAMRAGRDPNIVGGAVWWYRHSGQGFDPHIHMVLIGDYPMHWSAANQIVDFKNGLNGLASKGRDDFWRPPVIKNYVYLEDDMTPEESARLARVENTTVKILKRLNTFADFSKERDKALKSKLVTLKGELADQLTILINAEKDNARKEDLKKMKQRILVELAEDEDIDGVDNPSPEGLEGQ